jgi:hypothetical protein
MSNCEQYSSEVEASPSERQTDGADALFQAAYSLAEGVTGAASKLLGGADKGTLQDESDVKRPDGTSSQGPDGTSVISPAGSRIKHLDGTGAGGIHPDGTKIKNSKETRTLLRDGTVINTGGEKRPADAPPEKQIEEFRRLIKGIFGARENAPASAGSGLMENLRRSILGDEKPSSDAPSESIEGYKPTPRSSADQETNRLAELVGNLVLFQPNLTDEQRDALQSEFGPVNLDVRGNTIEMTLQRPIVKNFEGCPPLSFDKTLSAQIERKGDDCIALKNIKGIEVDITGPNPSLSSAELSMQNGKCKAKVVAELGFGWWTTEFEISPDIFHQLNQNLGKNGL